MIVATGVDILAIERVHGLWQRSGNRFLQRVFTASERDYCLQQARPAASLAVRFCAKEAVMKCLGTGWGGGVGFRSIEVARAHRGDVGITLHDVARTVGAQRGITRIHLSLSHDEHTAIAFAVAES